MTVVVNPSVPVGVIHQYAGLTAPGGYLLCDGSSVSRTTYSALFSALTITRGNPTVTIASPGVFTLSAHGLSIGEIVYLTTTGALPTGLSANTQYFVAATSFATNTFTLTATYGGSAINTSGTQSGTHTLVSCPYGFASSTNFNVPDMRGRSPIGIGTHADISALGLNDQVSLANRRPKHQHTVYDPTHNHNGDYAAASASGGAELNVRTANTATVYAATRNSATGIKVNPENASSSSSPTDAPAYIVTNYIIKAF